MTKHTSKYIFIILGFYFSYFNLFGQDNGNTLDGESFLCIGLHENGICVGNSSKCNGIKLNLWDKASMKPIWHQILKRMNGINLTFFSNATYLNGISLGLFGSNDSICNGLKISGLINVSHKMNGIAIGGLGVGAIKINGIGVGGWEAGGDTSNGLFLCYIGNAGSDTITNKLINGLKIGFFFGVSANKINGIAIGGIHNRFHIQNGISISCFNKANELHGVQFGILNYAGNNKKIFRWMPLLNFHLRRKVYY
jgi:hypothetical protein